MAQRGTKRLPTMSDVAQLAGVSRSTVSFVLNNTGISASIPEETKERILEAVKKTFLPAQFGG